MHTIVRVTTVPVSLQFLLKGQLKFMKQNGFNVIAASAKGKEVDQVIKNEECLHFSFPLTRTINPFLDFYCLVKMIFFLKKIKPTIVHSHTPKAGLIAMLAARISNVPVRLHTIAGLPWMEAKGIKKSILKFVERLTIKASTKIYVNSNNLLNYLIQEKFNANKLGILGKGSSNGIDDKYFSINTEIEQKAKELREKNNLQNKDWVWLFVGRIVKDKGIQELVDAFEKLQKQFPNDQLWLVGNFEPNLDPLDQQYFDKIKSSKNIIEWGFQNDVRPFYAASNMLTFPSYREGFPNVPIQAALMNCGLILSNINGCNEIVEHQKTGLLVDVKNANSLYEQLIFSRKNAQTIDIYKVEAKDYLINNFNQQLVWNNLLNEYKMLLNKHGL